MHACGKKKLYPHKNSKLKPTEQEGAFQLFQVHANHMYALRSVQKSRRVSSHTNCAERLNIWFEPYIVMYIFIRRFSSVLRLYNYKLAFSRLNTHIYGRKHHTVKISSIGLTLPVHVRQLYVYGTVLRLLSPKEENLNSWKKLQYLQALLRHKSTCS